MVSGQRESFVVDAGRNWKVRCVSEDHVILFVQAAKMFNDELGLTAKEKLVVYETGEELTSDSGFQEHRYYMYLKKGESYSVDPNFDVVGMAVQSPPGHPIRLQNYLFKEEAVAVYRDLIVNKKYLQENYLAAIELSKLQVMTPINNDLLILAMKRSIPDMSLKELDDVVSQIVLLAITHLVENCLPPQ